ncbi:MAG: DOMON domain-containing protein, partial [Planctomycetota bacterium]
MKATYLCVLSVLAAALTAGCEPEAAEVVVDIPQLHSITIDGDATDWGDDGYRVSWLTHMRSGGGDLEGPAEFDPTFRLGWTDEGLVVLAVVHDDAFASPADDQQLWANKADVMILYLIPERGGEEFTRIAVAPNAGPPVSKTFAEPPDPRVLVSVDASLTDREEQPSPYRAVDLAGKATDVRAARQTSKLADDPYVLEVLVRWSVVNVPGRMGHEFGLQVGFVDSDPTEDGKLSQGGAMWHPSHPVRLSHKASDPQLAAVTEDYYRNNRDYQVNVEGATELIGKTAEVRVGEKIVGEAVFEVGESGWAFASPQFRARPWKRKFDEVEVFVDGRSIGPVTLPEVKRRCAEMIVHHEMRPDGATFTGPRLPRLDFEEVETIEGITGPYELNVTYYDADYNEVTRAERPGRYGAVVEVVPHKGRPFKRFVTLYRTASQPDEDQWR